MNTIAIVIGIKVNDQIFAALPNVAWPKKATLKALARLKMTRLKRQVSDAFNKLAMSIIPLPAMPVAA